MTRPVEAIILVLGQYLLPDVDRCVSYCLANRYKVIAIVKDNLRQAVDYLEDGAARILVVADARHIDPRIEVVADPPSPDGRPRPRIID
jgi:hypothetical protein